MVSALQVGCFGGSVVRAPFGFIAVCVLVYGVHRR